MEPGVNWWAIFLEGLARGDTVRMNYAMQGMAKIAKENDDE